MLLLRAAGAPARARVRAGHRWLPAADRGYDCETCVPRTAPVIALDKCSLLAIPMAFIDNGPPTFQLAFKTRLLTDLASRLVATDTGVC